MIKFNKINTVIFICRHQDTLHQVPYRNKLIYLRSLINTKTTMSKYYESSINAMLIYNYPMFLLRQL